MGNSPSPGDRRAIYPNLFNYMTSIDLATLCRCELPYRRNAELTAHYLCADAEKLDNHVLSGGTGGKGGKRCQPVNYNCPQCPRYSISFEKFNTMSKLFLPPGSGIHCLGDPWIRDPGWVKRSVPYPDPG